MIIPICRNSSYFYYLIEYLRIRFAIQQPFIPRWRPPSTALAAFDLSNSHQLRQSQIQILIIFVVFFYGRISSDKSLYVRINSYVLAAAKRDPIQRKPSGRGFCPGRHIFRDFNLYDIALLSIICTRCLPQRFSIFTNPCRPFTTSLPQCQDFIHSPSTYLASILFVVGLILALDSMARLVETRTVCRSTFSAVQASPLVLFRRFTITLISVLIAFGKPAIWFPDSGRPLFSPLDIVKVPMFNCFCAFIGFFILSIVYRTSLRIYNRLKALLSGRMWTSIVSSFR